jgi:tetratricopeptide (TPR) repeat protein
MHKHYLLALTLGAAFQSAPALASGTAPVPVAPAQPAAASAAQLSPAQHTIAFAQKQIAADPKRAQPYDDLALAEIRRARETANTASLADAQTAVAAGLKVAPEDFQLQKTAIALLLARHQYTEALTKARALNKHVPDDVTVYGYMADADIALGNYPEAETSAQWMINLRPNNVPGLMVGAELRVLYGDPDGALEFLNQAFSETPQIEPEEQAWIANRIALVELDSGHAATAAQVLTRAEVLFPHDPVTQVNMARVLMQQNKAPEAIPLLQQRLGEEQSQQLSQSSTLFLLAMAQQQASPSASAATFARFAKSAQAEAAKPANDDTELILYQAGLPGAAPADPAAALTLAEHEMTYRHDVATLDAYAWALYANGKYAEAEVQAQKALAVGIHSARLDEHAGAIALKLHKQAQADQSFVAAMQADPTSPYAIAAQRQLGSGQAAMAAGAALPATQFSGQASGQAPTQVSAEALAMTATPRTAAAETAVAAIPIEESIDPGGVPTALLIPRPTGTERMIHRMQALVAAQPKDAAAYSGLGAAFFQRARETGDVEDFQLAEQALTKSLDLVSSDLTATAPLETMAEVCMGEHRFSDALDYAEKALALGSGDLSPFAIVGDAYADMGEYEKAGIAYSRLQPIAIGIPLAADEAYEQTTRTAYLKFIAGDTDAAIAEMRTAIGEGMQAHLPSENLAWLYYELGEFSFQAGQIQAAANAYFSALTIYPGDYRALAGLGKVRASQGKYKEAITFYQSAIAVVPMPLYVTELGDIYAKLGETAEAEKQYKLVEYIGLLGHINQVLHNRDLALFYANHDRNLPEALALAHKEFEVRSDIYTWDALAWALYKNGRYQEASDAMEHASRLGTKDPMLLFHAGMISAKLNHPDQAAAEIGEAMKINPHFNVLYAATAEQELNAMHKQGPLTAHASGLPHQDKSSQEKAANVQ